MRSLTLSGNEFGRAGLRTLLRSPHAGALKELSVRGGRLDGQAMAEFASARPGLRLEALDLGENVLKAVGAEYVALAPCLRELKALRLDRCEIPLDGARLLAKKATFLDGLRLLDVGHNHFGPGWPPCWSESPLHCTPSACATTTSSTRGRPSWPGRRRRTGCSRWT